MEQPWALEVGDIATELDTDLLTGLNDAEAARRLERDGPNVLEAAPPPSNWARFVRQFNDPLIMLLVVAIAISLLAWISEGADGAPLEAIVIGAIVVLNAVIGYWQEGRAIKAVAALRKLTSVHANVVRSGTVRSVLSDELVVGDIVLLAEGDAVAADGRLVESASLQTAEAPLTGESTSVGKTVEPAPIEADLGDRSSMVFSGTGVARGRGRAVIVATGVDSEIGRIATLLESATEERTPLQQQIDWLGRMLGLIVIVLAVIVVGAILLTSGVESAGDVFDALLVGVSLAVAAVPEGLPAILTVVLALGVQRMAERNAIVKKLLSVETLGSASVICTDKTGTLTRNEMTIVRIVAPSVHAELTGTGYDPVGHLIAEGDHLTDEERRREVELVLGAGSLANDATLGVDASGHLEVIGDPTEVAFLVAERKLGVDELRAGRFQRLAEVPFDSDRKLMTTIDRDLTRAGAFEASPPSAESSRGIGAVPIDDAEAGSELVMVTKGAPDVLLERCTHERVLDRIVPLDEARRAEIAREVDDLADNAMRTLGVAYRRLDELVEPVDELLERDLVHLGVVGIIDPPREEVRDAIADARGAGIRVIMITGDHPRTAVRIGEDLGIGDPGESGVTGADLNRLTDEEFGDVVRTRDVFARVAPEHKLRIVETLQRDEEIVSMTGDGVNDAPALKQANIGVSMGINGTEVSKEASDMILADDNFATIIRAVREGREIFANIRKFLRYLLASNSGEVLVVLLGVLGAGLLGLDQAAGDELAVPLLATQILWINLLTDSALALALGVDPPVENAMSAPPRRLADRVIDRDMWITIVLVGVTSAIAGLVALDLVLEGGMLGGSGDLDSARTVLFTTIVLAQVFNAFNSRSDRVSAFVQPFSNPLLWAAVFVTVLLQVAVVHFPPLNEAFDTVPMTGGEWALAAALSSSVLIVGEIRKLVQRADNQQPAPARG